MASEGCLAHMQDVQILLSRSSGADDQEGPELCLSLRGDCPRRLPHGADSPPERDSHVSADRLVVLAQAD
jgi:hypothetical protein